MIEVRFPLRRALDKLDDHTEKLQWCENTFGPCVRSWEQRNGVERWGWDMSWEVICFYFRDNEDAVLFSLRWT